MKPSEWFRAALMLIAMAVAAGTVACAQNAQGPASIKRVAEPTTEYRIGPADVLQISVWKNEELSRTVPVRPDGMISLPLVNDVRAAGLTPMQLRDVLLEKLSEYVPKAQVSVVVREVHSNAVSVLGEVRRAGRYEMKSRATVLDALANAGGITEFARRSRIVILRPDGNELKRIPFDYDDATSGSGKENIFVLPGDIIVVP